MQKYGLVKTLKTDDDQEIKLVGNALTYIIYKSYFGRDLLNDIINFATKNMSKDTIAKFEKFNIAKIEDIAELPIQDQNEILTSFSSYNFDSEFILNFIASLMATAMYPEKVDIIDLITSIPPYFVADDKIITELLDFFSLFISQKKRL